MDTSKLNIGDAYQKQIYDYIRDYHPQLFLDEDEMVQIVIDRANSAQEAFTKETLRGGNYLEAKYEANQALHAGLVFSPCSYIKEFYEELHNDIIENEQAVEIWLETKDIFPKYGEDFEGTDAEDNLREELEPFMKLKQ